MRDRLRKEERYMKKRELILFDKPGPKNTEATLKAVRDRACELGIKTVVLATTTGKTALRALDVLEGTGVRVIGVTLHAGCWKKYGAPAPKLIRAAEERGARFITATHTLMGNVSSAVREKLGGAPDCELISYTYYTFGQGMKVAVEVAVMAADAGLLEGEREIIAVAGTGTGADTAVVLSPAYSTDFFSLKIREVIAMPR